MYVYCVILRKLIMIQLVLKVLQTSPNMHACTVCAAKIFLLNDKVNVANS